jgi:DNA-binding CsgD family transcriptional regulator
MMASDKTGSTSSLNMLISSTGSYKRAKEEKWRHRREGNFKNDVGVESNEKLNTLLEAVNDAVEGKISLISLSKADQKVAKMIKVRPAREKGWALVSVGKMSMDPMTLDASILEQLFGLTPTECEVAFALLEHDKLADIAVVRNVSIETIRMHVKNIFVKTGMSSQKKLLALLTRIHAMSSNSG